MSLPMTPPTLEPTPKPTPKLAWAYLKLLAWAVCSTSAMLLVVLYCGEIVAAAFLVIAVFSAVGYLTLLSVHGWKMLPVLFFIGVLQCGGCYPVLYHLPPFVSNPARFQCNQNLRYFGELFSKYHLRKGVFPPAYVASTTGEPLYGWPVLFLQEMEENYLYDKFHFDEAWNSPHNAPLVERANGMLQCKTRKPFWAQQDGNYISYLAVVGPETAWPGPVGRPLSEFTDGPENTILLFEVASLDIPWAAPPALDLDSALKFFSEGSTEGASSRHLPPNISVLYADGHVDALPGDIPVETLRALLTVAGGEKVVVPRPERETSLP